MLEITNDMDSIVGKEKSVIAFTATWCQPCKAMKPHFAKLGMQDENNNYFVVDVDQIPEHYLQKFNIKSVPQVLVLDRGEQMASLSGRTFDTLKEEMALI